MKPCIKFFLPLLIVALGLISAGRVTAQIFTTLHSFTAFPINPNINTDGAYPEASLVLSGNTLYGTTQNGGSSGFGTTFSLNTDGTGFTNLHDFNGTSDGANPIGSLVLSGNTLFGTASFGGSSGAGTVFRLNTNGTGFTNLYSFKVPSTNSSGQYTNSDGANPYAGL